MYERGRAKKMKESAQTLEGLKSKFPNTEICDEEGLQKRLDKYQDVYIYIDPYNSEMKDDPTDSDKICWATDFESCEDNYFRSQEEI
jgi:hypothetical protein